MLSRNRMTIYQENKLTRNSSGNACPGLPRFAECRRGGVNRRTFAKKSSDARNKAATSLVYVSVETEVGIPLKTLAAPLRTRSWLRGEELV